MPTSYEMRCAGARYENKNTPADQRIVVSRTTSVGKRGTIDVYIGRPSVLGNPYVMKKEADRDAVCEQYIKWLDLKLLDETSPQWLEIGILFRFLVEGWNLNLRCYCAPKRCHGDQIKHVLDFMLKNYNSSLQTVDEYLGYVET